MPEEVSPQRDNAVTKPLESLQRVIHKTRGRAHGGGIMDVSEEQYAQNGVRLVIIARGFVYAIAHVRGGHEKGERWYAEGRMLNKRNTFTDFIAVTETLIAKGYGDPRAIFAQGGSAGGLLMGTIANLRPDLYAGIVAEVPFVDLVTAMSDASAPLTTLEYDEWGNPAIEPEYDYMLSIRPTTMSHEKATRRCSLPRASMTAR